MVRRSGWVDQRVSVLVSELSDMGLVVAPEHAATLIRDRVSAVSAGMRISKESARRYVTDDVVRELAWALTLSLAEEQPGADVLEGPRTIPVPLATIGRTIAALAEAAHVRAHNIDDVGTHGALQVISMLGQVLSEGSAAGAGSVLLPQAALTRGARLLETTSEIAEAGVADIADMSDEAKGTIAAAFDRDAAKLRTLVAEHGTDGGPVPLS